MITLRELRLYHYTAGLRALEGEQYHRRQLAASISDYDRNHHAKGARMACSTADWHFDAANALNEVVTGTADDDYQSKKKGLA